MLGESCGHIGYGALEAGLGGGIPRLSPRGSCASKNDRPSTFRDNSASGREWGWVMGMLRSGMSPDIVLERLVAAANGRGKNNAAGYARRTVRKAVGKLENDVRCSNFL